MAVKQAGTLMSFSMGSSSFVEIMSTATKTLVKSGGEASVPRDKTPAKARKPYTITKQRERWTEDEHQKFLEALKLYGRAWRRIEEHIGTKTAVQIRSHAQKFFSKLEREASTGGPLASADVEIPPPRPKRKPSHPYPRKEGLDMSSTPSSEEESKSTTVTSSLEDPVERTNGRILCNSLLKVAQAAQAGQELSSSLRLFGKTVTVEGGSAFVSDAYEQRKPSSSTAVKESESTGSPRSQLTVEETSAISMLSSADVCKVEVDAPVCLSDGVMAENAFPCKADADSKTKDVSCVGLVAKKMNQPPSLPASQTISNALQYGSQTYHGSFTFPGPTSCGIIFPFWHPCYAMPSAPPSLFPAALPSGWNGTKEDGDAAAAIAAATFLIASAWQAIQGTAPISKEHPNTSMVYCPVAIAAAANSKRSSNPLGKDPGDEPISYREHNACSIDKDEPISSTVKDHSTLAPNAECTGDNCAKPDTDGEAQERKRLKRMHDGKEGELRTYSSHDAATTLNGGSTIPVPKESEGNASCDAKIDVQASSLRVLRDSDDAADVTTLANADTEMHQGHDILSQKNQECSLTMEDGLVNPSGSCHSEPLFMMRTRPLFMMRTRPGLSNSRYSGAGFVPYKRSSAPVESSTEADLIHR